MKRGKPSAPAPINIPRAEWLTYLRAAVKDADAVSRDMLRRPYDRELGPAEHRAIYGDAADMIAHVLDHPPPESDEHGDPAGSGGSPAL